MQTTSVEQLIRRADKLMENKRYDEAEPLLLVALKRAPKNPEPYYLLGEVFCKQHRFTESIEILQKANRVLPNNPNILHLLGWATFMNGNIPKSRRFMELAWPEKSKDIHYLCDFAVIEMKDFNFVKAKEYARIAMNIAPHNDLVLEVNGVVESISQEYKAALRHN